MDKKQFMTWFIEAFGQAYQAFIQPEFDKLNKRVDSLETYVKGPIFTNLDKTYKEVLDMRTEQAAHQSQHDRVEKKLKKLEGPSATAHQLKRSRKTS
jgi:hypothetical protein